MIVNEYAVNLCQLIEFCRRNNSAVRRRRVRVFRDHAMDLRLSFRLSNPLVHLLHVARPPFLTVIEIFEIASDLK